jgi:hypothetical protein
MIDFHSPKLGAMMLVIIATKKDALFWGIP